MTTIHKKIVVDDKGAPQEVIIPWKTFCEIEEALGLDLGEQALTDLEEADKDMKAGNKEAFVSLDDL